MKLRAKIPLLLIPFTVVPLLVLGWIAYHELRLTTEQSVFREMEAVSYRLAAALDAEVETAASNIELFAKHTLVTKYVLTADDGDRYSLMLGPLLRVFTGYQEAFPNYYEIRILRPDGFEDARLNRLDLPNVRETERGSVVFQEMTRAGEGVYRAVFRNPDNGRVSLFVGKPLILRDPVVDTLDATPRLRGYLVLTVDLSEIEAQIRTNRIGLDGYHFVTDDAGGVWMQPDATRLPAAIDPELLAAADRSGSDTSPSAFPFAGRKSYVRGVRLQPELYLFSVLPQDELVAASYELAVVIAAITLITIGLSTACLYFGLDHLIIRPIRRLGTLAKEIGSGRWNIDSGVIAKDEIGELASSFKDMAGNLSHSDAQIRYLAYHDSLTGLPNRVLFKDCLDRAIGQARRANQLLAVLFLDLDDFKRVNDTLGHQLGDKLLREVAERLTACLRQTDRVARPAPDRGPTEVLARLGGDEFIVLLPDLKDARSPGRVARRITSALSMKYQLDGHECYAAASIGITMYPADGTGADELIKNADLAMYHAKENGKNSFQYFNQSMNVAAIERMALETRLRKALENDEMRVHYQPQVDAASGEVIGFEALARWRDPDRGETPPEAFIPVAEESGLILPIGEFVLRSACRQAHEWQRQRAQPVKLSVNISGVQFSRQDVAALIADALDESGLDPGCLEIEITESIIMADPEHAVRSLDRIRALGVRIALDDFGTGYSSLSYLRRFPIDTLKIDRSFIGDLESKRDDAEIVAEIVAAIIAMAHSLKLRVIVEGVENERQRRMIVERGGDVMQGFLFSEPLPAEAVPDLLTAEYASADAPLRLVSASAGAPGSADAPGQLARAAGTG